MLHMEAHTNENNAAEATPGIDAVQAEDDEAINTDCRDCDFEAKTIDELVVHLNTYQHEVLWGTSL